MSEGDTKSGDGVREREREKCPGETKRYRKRGAASDFIIYHQRMSASMVFTMQWHGFWLFMHGHVMGRLKTEVLKSICRSLHLCYCIPCCCCRHARATHKVFHILPLTTRCRMYTFANTCSSCDVLVHKQRAHAKCNVFSVVACHSMATWMYASRHRNVGAERNTIMTLTQATATKTILRKIVENAHAVLGFLFLRKTLKYSIWEFSTEFEFCMHM